MHIFAIVFFLIFGVCTNAIEGFAQSKFPSLHAGMVFGGEIVKDKLNYRMDLIVQSEHVFFMQETWAAPQGRVTNKETSGKWRQIKGGSFLQLTNRHGYYQLLTVGAENLYFDVRLSPFFYSTIVLRGKPEHIEILRSISGKLIIKENRLLIEDFATGVLYQLHGNEVASLAAQCQLETQSCFVQGKGAVYEGNSDNIPLFIAKHLEVLPRSIPRIWESTPTSFQDRVTNQAWRLISSCGLTLTIADFQFKFIPSQKDFNTGELEFWTGTQRYITSYRVHGDKLEFKKLLWNIAELPLEFQSEMFTQPMTWLLEGDWLELSTPTCSYTFEK